MTYQVRPTARALSPRADVSSTPRNVTSLFLVPVGADKTTDVDHYLASPRDLVPIARSTFAMLIVSDDHSNSPSLAVAQVSRALGISA